MTAIELLRIYQGDMPRAQFADALGVSVKLLDAIFSGNRRITESFLVRLAKAFPASRDQVAELLFFAPEYHDCSEHTTDHESLCNTPSNA